MGKFAVIGNPVQHSLSPQIHQRFAAEAGVKIEYLKIESPLDDFANTLLLFKKQGGKGCNITVPFKEQAFMLSNKLGDYAKIAGAVNCIKFQNDEVIFGENVDGIGLIEDLTKNKSINLCKKKILIIGAGGAARGIIAPLLEQSPQRLCLTNRTQHKAVQLAKHFSDGDVHVTPVEQLSSLTFDLIINATSAGHQGKLLDLPSGFITDSSICYDLSYGPAAAPFLNWAKDQGAAQIFDGFGMLIEQAAASFHLWLGFYPSTEKIIANGIQSI